MADYKCSVRKPRELIIIYKQEYPSSVLNLFNFFTVKGNVLEDAEKPYFFNFGIQP